MLTRYSIDVWYCKNCEIALGSRPELPVLSYDGPADKRKKHHQAKSKNQKKTSTADGPSSAAERPAVKIKFSSKGIKSPAFAAALVPKPPQLARFRSVYSDILPEEREHGSDYYHLSDPQRCTIDQWKDAIMRSEMLKTGNAAFLKRNNLTVPLGMDEETYCGGVQIERFMGCMTEGGWIIELKDQEVINKDLSVVMKMIDDRVQVKLDAEGYKDVPYQEPGAKIKFIKRGGGAGRQAAGGGQGDDSSGDDPESSGSEDEQDVGPLMD